MLSTVTVRLVVLLLQSLHVTTEGLLQPADTNVQSGKLVGLSERTESSTCSSLQASQHPGSWTDKLYSAPERNTNDYAA